MADETQEFPQMLARASKDVRGDVVFEDLIVADATERQDAADRGFFVSRHDAVKALDPAHPLATEPAVPVANSAPEAEAEPEPPALPDAISEGDA